MTVLHNKHVGVWGDRRRHVDVRQAHIQEKKISKPQTDIKTATFWWPVTSCNHWATETQMESRGAGSTSVVP